MRKRKLKRRKTSSQRKRKSKCSTPDNHPVILTIGVRKPKKEKSEVDMDVDGEADGEGEGDEEEDDVGGDTEEDEPNEMSVDEDGENEDGRRPRKQKLQPRKSQINVDAITQEQEVLAHMEHNDLVKMKLRKKYCKEAINFIHQMEMAIEVIVKLLGSKNKFEVLEAIDFFKAAHEYRITGAQVRLLLFSASSACIHRVV
jgi:condensin complex subunit 1